MSGLPGTVSHLPKSIQNLFNYVATLDFQVKKSLRSHLLYVVLTVDPMNISNISFDEQSTFF